ncbi:UNVERIFIED_CONTAM: Retrovirus-related Pol polyprotein from transposon TNT 1-94 [Sesamum radiatum]|uniref:Retrovirus-related Pol polyprotein from transposon TNT 1-94 n=1 Tax=Sesamum radiatum TaxID=300843 RepID=A0AAW2JE13_SESRA
MTERSPVQEHGVKMLSLVEKLEDLKAGLNNDTYIDTILQLLLPSYDPFIVNFNMNGLEKSINELINMLVQYEAMTKKLVPLVLVGEASTSKAKDKRAGRWKRKKGNAKAKVLQRSRKLSKDEVDLRLGDGTAVAAEAVGTVNLVISDRVRLELKDTTTDSTIEVEYIATLEEAKEAVWMKNYIQELGVVSSIAEPVVIFCDNNGAIAQAKEPRSHHRSKHILKRYHLLREMVGRCDVQMDRVNSAENTADPLTKPVSQIARAQHLGKMGLRQVSDWFQVKWEIIRIGV